MHRLSRCLVLALPFFVTVKAIAADTPFEPSQAKLWFDEAHRQCSADHGRLWGASLCGPIMFVDPATRRVMTNQADAQGQLKPDQGVYVGQLPANATFANTALAWGGLHWAQMIWPMPADAGQRRTLMAHESFHRIEPQIGLPLAPEGGADHLDTLQGRYLMRLEWRALGQALKTTDEKGRREYAEDALLFRAARYQQFPHAAEAERAQERNEGLAEYTGVTVGAISPAERLQLTLDDLAKREQAPSFVRSFAYGTGPAYGMLLDRYLPTWRDQIRASNLGLSDLLATALGYHARSVSEQAIQSRAVTYQGGALLASEQLREQRRQQQVASYKATLVEGPVLVLPLHGPKFSFNPNTLVPLGDAGTVYPTMQVSADWGTIEVTDGALMSPDWTRLTVAAPKGTAVRAGILAGQGWTLKLKPGWHVIAGARAGDMSLSDGVAQTKAPDNR